uniref:Uncharacterized protein n=1 Tax=Panthera tigris altaica TaxID=74533 RepID=A0A8C9IZS9_PANTA
FCFNFLCVFKIVLSYSWLKLDHTVADCMIFTWAPCRMPDYLYMKSSSHQTLLFKWLDTWATKELELHLLGIELFWNVLLHFGKSQLSARGTFFHRGFAQFCFKRCLVFLYTHVVGRSSLPVCPRGLGLGGCPLSFNHFN